MPKLRRLGRCNNVIRDMTEGTDAPSARASTRYSTAQVWRSSTATYHQCLHHFLLYSRVYTARDWAAKDSWENRQGLTSPMARIGFLSPKAN
jgi:hypothetical protein